MTKTLQIDRFHLGVCYYPEHWPESMWEDDYRRMRELGFSVVRLAEFAWSIFEPEEGKFEFDLFDRAIDAAHRHGIKVILGTPTATPPAWLTHKYPEVLNAAQDGVIYRHGQRRHYNYNAPKYRELSVRIVSRMAEHYGSHPGVVGWQIDNELNCEVNVFYSEADHAAFREWLKRKYRTLNELNEAWGAVFWNQTYTDWGQVRLTGPTPSQSPNPHQALDEKRFFSDSAIFFAELQADVLRKQAPDQWITTNGIFGHLDSHDMTERCLDFISYDSYPNFSAIRPDEGEEPLLDRKWSWPLSNARNMSPNFCIMEQQSGPGGWVNRMKSPSPKPGQMRLWTYQSIAHGADMLLYFRWRTAAFGTEIYWHGINDYHNRPNRRVEEAGRIGRELEAVGERLAGSVYRADVAIVKDYDNEWDGELDDWHGPLSGKSNLAWFNALQRRHIPADVLTLRPDSTVADLSRYKLLIYPHPAILPDSRAELLKDYVRQGGTIVFGCRSGYKNASGHCCMRPFPGPIADLCGIHVEDFTAIGPHQTAPGLDWQQDGAEGDVKAEQFNEILEAAGPQTEIIAEYAAGYYAGKPALTKNRFGEGAAYYYGAGFSVAAAERLLSLLDIASPAAQWLSLSREVELAERIHPETGERFTFLLNYSHSPQPVTLRIEVRELLTGQKLAGEQELEPYGVRILKEE